VFKTFALGFVAVALPTAAFAQDAAAPKQGGRMMMRADANNDGAISREEFVAQATRRFERLDLNRDGKIDQAEREQIRQRMRAWRGVHGGHVPAAPPRS
jgi:hypothetical protein